MMGRRVQPNADGWIDGLLQPGDYFKATAPTVKDRPAGEWHAQTPNGYMCNLGNHQVIEHDDGSITVSPSILVSTRGRHLWHGYLERGQWREL